MADMEESYKDAPVENPYGNDSMDDFQAGIARHQRNIDALVREQEQRKAERKRLEDARQAEIDRVAGERARRQNEVILQRAKEDGLDDYLVPDSEGVLRSSLTEDQIARHRANKKLEEEEMAKRSLAKEQASRTDPGSLKDQLSQIDVLSEAKRKSEEESLQANRDQIRYLEASVWEEKDQLISGVREKIRASENALKADDEAIDQKAAIEAEILRNQRIAEGFPEDLARDVDGRRTWTAPPAEDDPEAGGKWLDAYNREVEINNSRREQISETEKKAADAYQKRVKELESSFVEWAESGATPKQIAEAKETLQDEWGKATAEYLKERYKFESELKKSEARSKSLDLLRPIVGDYLEDLKGYYRGKEEEAEKAQKQKRDAIADKLKKEYYETFGKIPLDGREYVDPADPVLNEIFKEQQKLIKKGWEGVPDDYEHLGPYAASMGPIGSKEDKIDYAQWRLSELDAAFGRRIEFLMARNSEVIMSLQEILWKMGSTSALPGSPSLLKQMGKYNFDSNLVLESHRFPLYNKEDSPVFDRVEAGVATVPLQIAANISLAFGYGLSRLVGHTARTVKKAAPGTQYKEYRRFDEWLENSGLTHSEAKHGMQEVLKGWKKWGKPNEEMARYRADGVILLNPDLNVLDRGLYKKAIESTDAPSFIKKHYLGEGAQERIRNVYASSIEHQANAAYAGPGGIPMPNEWMKEAYPDNSLSIMDDVEEMANKRAELREQIGTLDESDPALTGLKKEEEELTKNIEMMRDVAKNARAEWRKNTPEYSEQIEEWLRLYGRDKPLAYFTRPARSLALGGGKFLQTITGVGAILEVPGARNATLSLADGIEEQRVARDFAGGAIPVVSAITDVIGEEGPSLVFSLIPGTALGARAAALVRKQVVAGALTKKAASKQVAKAGLRGSAIGAGVQSTGLSWAQYFNDAKRVREEELGRPLTESELNELAKLPAVQGRAVMTGLLTAGTVKAFGFTGTEVVWRKGTNITVRDWWRHVASKANTTPKEAWQKWAGAVKAIAKPGIWEGLEEGTDQVISSLAFDRGISMGEALSGGGKAAIAGLILGSGIGGLMSTQQTGAMAENLSNPDTALEALKDVFGKTDYTQGEVEDAFELINYPANAPSDADAAARKLQAGILANRSLAEAESRAKAAVKLHNTKGEPEAAEAALQKLKEVNAAKGLLKIASGKVNNELDLTSEELEGVNKVVDDYGSPLLREVNGQLVITKAGTNLITEISPDAASELVALNEEARLRQIREASAPKVAETDPKVAKTDPKVAKPKEEAETAPKEAETAPKEAETAPEVAKTDPKVAKPAEAAAKPDVSKIKGAAVEGGRQVIRNSKGEHYSKRASAQIRLDRLIKDKKLPATGFSVVEEEAGKWIIAEDVKGEEAAPSGGKKKWRVTIKGVGEKTRAVEVEAETRTDAIAAAAKEADTAKGETVVVASATQIETDAPATQEAPEEAPEETKEPEPAAHKVAKVEDDAPDAKGRRRFTAYDEKGNLLGSIEYVIKDGVAIIKGLGGGGGSKAKTKIRGGMRPTFDAFLDKHKVVQTGESTDNVSNAGLKFFYDLHKTGEYEFTPVKGTAVESNSMAIRPKGWKGEKGLSALKAFRRVFGGDTASGRKGDLAIHTAGEMIRHPHALIQKKEIAPEAKEAPEESPEETKETASVRQRLQELNLFNRVVDETEETPLPKGKLYSIDKNGNVILSRKVSSFSKTRQSEISAEIVAERGAAGALSQKEGEFWFSMLPKHEQESIAREARLKHNMGKDASDADVVRYMLAKGMTLKMLETLSRGARKLRKGDEEAHRTVLGYFLRYLRRFADRIRAITTGDSLLARRLQFYEKMAFAFIAEHTNARTLASLGIAIPDSRISDRRDVVLHPNIRKTKDGKYEVTLPGGTKQKFKTLAEAREKNANKYRDQTLNALSIATAALRRGGGLSADELEAKIAIIKKKISTIAAVRPFITKESLWAKFTVVFVDGEYTSLIEEYKKAKPKSERAQKLEDAIAAYLGKLVKLNEDITRDLENATLREKSRGALAASRMVASFAADVADGNLAQTEPMRQARREFLALVGKGPVQERLRKLPELVLRQERITERIAALATEKEAVGGLPLFDDAADPAEMANLKKELGQVTNDIASAHAELDADYAAKVGRLAPRKTQKATTRGISQRVSVPGRGLKSVMGLTREADASTILHEFVHVLQKTPDETNPDQSLWDSALGRKNAAKLRKWAKSVNPAEPEEAEAEAMETYLKEGKGRGLEVAPSLLDAFSRVASAIYGVYGDTMREKGGGYDIPEETVASLDALFADPVIIGNSVTANAAKIRDQVQRFWDGAMPISEEEVILGLPNGAVQVGFKKAKVAKQLIEKNYRAFFGDSAKVVEYEGKFYAGLDINKAFGETERGFGPSLQRTKAKRPNAGNDRFRVGTSRSDSTRRRDTASNIGITTVSDDLLARQMEKFDYDHLPQSIRSERNPQTKREKAIEWMVENILAVHDALPKEVRERAAQWYDGASKLANKLAKKYKYTKVQTAGVIAVLSPQNGWFKNASQAEKVIDIYANHRNEVIDPKIHGEAMELIISKAQAAQSAKKKVVEGETPRQKALRQAYNRRLDEQKRDQRRAIMEGITGYTINQLGRIDSEPQSWALRVLATHYWSSEYNVLSPEGDILWVQRKNPTKAQLRAGEEGSPSTHGWGSAQEIGNAIAILKNGSLENLHRILGNEHKVRSFFNNIVAPNSAMGDVTMDTHAVAAAHLMPWGISAIAVDHNFGGRGIPNSKVAEGVSGLYHLYADAYREAARRRGILPREMQSIAWEGIRLIHPSEQKKPKHLAEATKTWKNNSNARARKIIINRSRSFYPEWFVREQTPRTKKVTKGTKEDGSRLEPSTSRTTGAKRSRRRGRSAPSLQREKELTFPGIQKVADGPSQKVIETSFGTLGKTGEDAYTFLTEVYGTSEAFNEILRDTGFAPGMFTYLYPKVKKAEKDILRDWAEENNLLNDFVGFFHEHAKNGQGGYENFVIHKGKYVEKVYHGDASLLERLHQILWHNYYFPEAAYEVLGFMAKDDDFFIHVRQPALTEDQDGEHLTKEEAKEFSYDINDDVILMGDGQKPTRQGRLVAAMAEMGLVPISNTTFFDPEENVIISDLYRYNFAIELGRPIPFDPALRSGKYGNNKFRGVLLQDSMIQLLKKKNLLADLTSREEVEAGPHHQPESGIDVGEYIEEVTAKHMTEHAPAEHEISLNGQSVSKGRLTGLLGSSKPSLQKAPESYRKLGDPPERTNWKDNETLRREVDDQWLELAKESGHTTVKGEMGVVPDAEIGGEKRKMLAKFTRRLAEMAGLVPSPHLPPTLFHGTMRQFTAFKVRDDHTLVGEDGDMVLSNYWGNGVYLTTSNQDAYHNYARVGPDMRAEAKQRAKEILEAPTVFQSSQLARAGQRGVTREQQAYVIALAELSLDAEGSFVHEVYVQLENPAIIGPDERGVHVRFSPAVDVNHPVLDAVEAVRQNLEEKHDVVAPRMEAMAKLAEILVDSRGASYERVGNFLRDNLLYIAFEKGAMATKVPLDPQEMARRVFAALGHDGIIDRRAGSKFRKMKGVDPDTAHVLVFRPEQVKSADAVTYHPITKEIVLPSQRFDFTSSQINLQGGVDERGARASRSVGVRKALEEIDEVKGWNRNPLNTWEIVTDTGVAFEVLRSKENHIYLKAIATVGERKKGHAGNVLEKLKQIADKHDVGIELYPSAFIERTGERGDELTQKELENFYKKRGFVRQKSAYGGPGSEFFYHKNPLAFNPHINEDPQSAEEAIESLRLANRGEDLSQMDTGMFSEEFEESYYEPWSFEVPGRFLIADSSPEHIADLDRYIGAMEDAAIEYSGSESVDPNFEDYIDLRIRLMQVLSDFLQEPSFSRGFPPTRSGRPSLQRGIDDADADKPSDLQESSTFDIDRMLKLVGKNMYGTNPAGILGKELFQNSVDAVMKKQKEEEAKMPARIEQFVRDEWSKAGVLEDQVESAVENALWRWETDGITPEGFNEYEPTILVHEGGTWFGQEGAVLLKDESGEMFEGKLLSFADNGIGMSPETVWSKFLPAFVSAKGVGEGGGFGIAKLVFLMGPNNVRVSTVNEDAEGRRIMTEVEIKPGAYKRFLNKGKVATPDNMLEPGNETEVVPGLTIKVSYAPEMTSGADTGTAYIMGTPNPNDPNNEQWNYAKNASWNRAVEFIREASELTPHVSLATETHNASIRSQLMGTSTLYEKREAGEKPRIAKGDTWFEIYDGETQRKKTREYVIAAIRRQDLELVERYGNDSRAYKDGLEERSRNLERPAIYEYAGISRWAAEAPLDTEFLRPQDKINNWVVLEDGNIETDLFEMEILAKEGDRQIQSGSIQAKILNRTIYQFDETVSMGVGEEGLVPAGGIAINIRSKVGAGEAGYPFSLDRNNVSQEVKDEINTFMGKLAHIAYTKQRNQWVNRRKNTVLIRRPDKGEEQYGPEAEEFASYAAVKEWGQEPGDYIEVPGEFHFLDLSGTLDEGVVEEFAKDPVIAQIAEDYYEIQGRVLKYLKLRNQHDPDFGRAGFAGFAVGTNAYGLHFPLKYVMDKKFVSDNPTDSPPSLIYHDPLATLQHVIDEHSVGELAEIGGAVLPGKGLQDFKSGAPMAYYTGLYQVFLDEVAGIAVHEALHQSIHSEGVSLARGLTFNAGGLASTLQGFATVQDVLGTTDPDELAKRAKIRTDKLKDYYEQFEQDFDEQEAQAFITGTGAKGYNLRIEGPRGRGKGAYPTGKPDSPDQKQDDGRQKGGKLSLQGLKDAEEGAERAKKRMDRRGKPLRERFRIFRKRDDRTAAGAKVVKGDPSRAKVGETPEVRNAYDVSQEIYNDTYIAQNFPEWMSGAAKVRKTEGDDEIRKKIYESAEKLGQPGTPEFQIASMQVVADDFQRALASGNQTDIDNAMALAHAFQELRSEIARTMTSMRDPFQTPAQRAAYALGQAITQAPPLQVRALQKKHGAKEAGDEIPSQNKEAYKEDLKKMDRNRLDKSKAALVRRGMGVEEIFNSSNEGVAIGTKVDKDALGKLPPKQRKVVEMAREGADPEAIEMATGVSQKGQKRALEKFREVLRPAVESLVQRGFNEGNMQEFASGKPPAGNTKPGTKEDVEKVLSKSFKASIEALSQKGFNINNPTHVMAAFRALDDVDLDYVTRTMGTWYANVFSSKTVLINMLSIPFAGYRAIAERGVESLFNHLLKHPEVSTAPEFKYIAKGLKTYASMAFYQAFMAFDTETAYFNTFAKGETSEGSPYKGETHEEVRGYQMGHILDGFDILIDKYVSLPGIKKKGESLKRPSLVRRAIGEKGATTEFRLGKMGRGVLRFNMGVDEFMRFMVAGSEIGGIAYRMGRSKGLDGDALEEFIHKEMTIPGSSSWIAAANEANISVFTQDLPDFRKGDVPKSIGGVLSAAINGLDQFFKGNEKALRASKEVSKVTESGITKLADVALIDGTRIGLGVFRVAMIPFARVLANLVVVAYERVPNPISLMWHGYHVAKYAAKHRGLQGEDRMDMAAANSIRKVSRQTLAHIIAWALLGMFEGDDDDGEKPILITGSMPKFRKGASAERRAAYREGMGPYKIRVKADANVYGIPVGKILGLEEDYTFDYGRIDPGALILGTTVDWVREFKKLGRGDTTMFEAGYVLAADTVAAQLTDKTMLRGMNDAFGMISGRVTPYKWTARNLATILVPNLIRQPIRDGNLYYDATLSVSDAESFKRMLLYEMFPNADSRILGFDVPFKSKFAPGASRDAYGELMKRPRGFGSWIAKQQPHKLRFFDQMIRAQRKMEPFREDISLPMPISNEYVYTDEETGLKQKHKMTPLQYDIVQRAFQSIWQTERLSVTNADEVSKARRRASDAAREIAYKTPAFLIDAKREFNRRIEKKKR